LENIIYSSRNSYSSNFLEESVFLFVRTSLAIIAKVAIEKVQLSILGIVFLYFLQQILYSTLYLHLNIISHFFIIFLPILNERENIKLSHIL
jgi:hypothetical protein